LWLRSGQPFLVWVWKISPKYVKLFNFFPWGQKKSHRVGSKSTRVKGGVASYLLWVKSKLGSGQGPSLNETEHDASFHYFHFSLTEDPANVIPGEQLQEKKIN